MPGAERIFYDKFIFADGAIREMIIWKLPESSNERQHRLKYSLFYGYPGKRLVGYDNELGKGDHRHYENTEERYSFATVENLISDFRSDVERLRGI